MDQLSSRQLIADEENREIHMTEIENEEDLQQSIANDQKSGQALADLFGEDIVEQARLIDSADLNINDDMARQIAEGIKQLKQNRRDINAQQCWIRDQAHGLQVLLCLWIMD